VAAHLYLVYAMVNIFGSKGTFDWIHDRFSRLTCALCCAAPLQYRAPLRNSQSFFRMDPIADADHVYLIVGYEQY